VILGSGTVSPSASLLARARAIAPLGQIVVPVLEEHSPWWERTLADVPKDNLVVQPFDRGSGVAMLLAFIRIFRGDPSARVVLLWEPEGDAEVALRRALAEAERGDDRIVIVGGTPGTIGSLCFSSSAALLRLFQTTLTELFDVFIARAGAVGANAAHALDEIYPFLPRVDFVEQALRGAEGLVRRVGVLPPLTELREAS
jgi:hypothetical protein